MKGLPVVALGLLLAACTPGPTAEELRAMDMAACDEAGFEPGSDAHRLCLLLQETNRRLDMVGRRLDFLELDVRNFFNRPFGYCRNPC